MKRFIPLLSVAVFCLFIIAALPACRKCHDPKNPNCKDYDPCYGEHNLYTNFTVKDGSGSFPPPEDWCATIPCDTLGGIWAEFTVPDGNTDNCTYRWTIGTDTTKYTKKQFQLDFGDWIKAGHKNEPLPVKLQIKRPLDACIQNPQDTLKTVTRSIVFTSPIYWSTFTGYYENNPSKPVTISRISLKGGSFRGIRFQSWETNELFTGLPTGDTILMNNLGSCSTGNGYFKGYKIKSYGCNQDEIHGFLVYQEVYWINQDQVRAVFTFNSPTDKNTYIFHGRRVK